jgi:hypothetical protein
MHTIKSKIKWLVILTKQRSIQIKVMYCTNKENNMSTKISPHISIQGKIVLL